MAKSKDKPSKEKKKVPKKRQQEPVEGKSAHASSTPTRPSQEQQEEL